MSRVLRRAWSRLLGSFRGGRREGDLADELEAHIQLMADDGVRRGLSPAEARRQARVAFGSVDSAKEGYRDQRGLPALDLLAQDLRYAFRGIRRNPGFAAVAILSLAVGIGANTAIFSLVNTVLLRPLAYKDPDRVYWTREVTTLGRGPMNPVHAREWAKECRSIEQLALMRGNPADVAGGSEPVAARGVAVSHNVFALLGVEPMLGRSFLPEEEQPGNEQVVMLSEGLWRSRFNADRGLVGRSISVDRKQYQVVGIVPDWFRLPFVVQEVKFDVYRPLALTPAELLRVDGNYNYAAILRVKAGATVAQTLAEIDAVQARYRRSTGSSRTLSAALVPVHELVTGRARLGLWMLTAAVGAVLLIVCVNLANLLLSRMASRQREAAIRTALGASRGRQFRMVVTESLLLAVSGGVLGIVFAGWCVQLLGNSATLGLPRLYEVRLDSVAVAFAFALTLCTAVVFSVIPAWRLTSGDPQVALRAGSRSATEGRGGLRLREWLIGVEVALSAVLLVMAGLLTGSLSRLLHVEKGFDADRVLTVDLRLAGEVYSDPANQQRFFDRLMPKLHAIPGVRAAGLITYLPTLGNTWNDSIYLEGASRDQRHSVDNRYASPGYFPAMDIAVRQGRLFEERDRGQHVALLSEKAARLLWPNDPNPVGRRFVGEDDKPKTLVGIVAEVRAALQTEPPPMAYYPYWQRVPAGASLVLRTAGDPRAAAGALRAAVRGEDAQLPIPTIRTMEEVVDDSVAPRRLQLALMAVFAVSALFVACLGIYGVVSYSVACRKQEIGIRMALGAPRPRVLRLVIGQGLTPVLGGLAAGVAAALALGRAIGGLLFEVRPTDPLVIAAVCGLLLVAGVVACVVPARRAASADVIAALRSE